MFTPLETLLMTGAASLVVGIAVALVTRSTFVSQRQCKDWRDAICGDVCQARQAQGEMHADIKARTVTLFRMVRALVAHNQNMPPEVKADILNETPGGSE